MSRRRHRHPDAEAARLGWPEGSRPIWGGEIGCAHGVGRSHNCRRCARETRRIEEAVDAAEASRGVRVKRLGG